jgi:hypothetical protein
VVDDKEVFRQIAVECVGKSGGLLKSRGIATPAKKRTSEGTIGEFVLFSIGSFPALVLLGGWTCSDNTWLL